MLIFIIFQDLGIAKQGESGELRVISWQAVSTLNPYLSGGDKDAQAASLVLESLASFNSKGQLVAKLAENIPTLENGGISADMKSITWKLKKGIKWSDGSNLTADDVVFTWKYCTSPGIGCQQKSYFNGISSVEAIDPLTVKIVFENPRAYSYGVFTSLVSPIIHKEQFKNCLGVKASECTSANFNPHGTGPFRVKDFKANDVVIFEVNPYYRNPEKPFFSKVTLKGGGDSLSSARSVLETGEYDFGVNIQVEPEVLQQIVKKSVKGVIGSAFGGTVERINLNPFAVDFSLGSKRSTKEAGPHPFLSDPSVRRALSIAIDRSLIVDEGYGPSGRPTCNILPAPEAYVSTANDWCLKQDIEGANNLLDKAGWVKGSDGIRSKNGVRLSMLYQTSVNSVRQGTQSLIKDMWKKIGVETELRNINSSVFFGSDPSSPDTVQRFYADAEMYADTFAGIDPEVYMQVWTCEKIPSPATSWHGENISRYCNQRYDDLVKKYQKTINFNERVEIAKQLNDILSGEVIHIPLVHRGMVYAYSNKLQGIELNGWDTPYWNIENWHR
ncbi:peptide ABC transporter [Liberibacter crescens]|nr:peptide ABC transporter [Liberibacter crescens]